MTAIVAGPSLNAAANGVCDGDSENDDLSYHESDRVSDEIRLLRLCQSQPHDVLPAFTLSGNAERMRTLACRRIGVEHSPTMDGG
jgi:hypothetical protein